MCSGEANDYRTRQRVDFCVFGSPCRKRTLFVVGNVDSRDSHRVLEQFDVAVSQDKNLFIQRVPHHAESFALHVTTPALPFCLSRLPWFSP